MTRADVTRWVHQMVRLLRGTHPALLMPALLLLAAMGALALALVVVAAVAALVLVVVGAFVGPMLAGLDTLLGSLAAWQPGKAVAS